MPEMDGFVLAQRITHDRRYAGTKLVMLTSAGVPEDVARCRKLGISAYLTKPVKQSELFDVVVSVISEPVVEKLKSPKKPRARRSGLHVLLAEDNQVNQLVATRILEKLGHQVTVVGSGREAVSAVQSGKFDVIAMDVQMPEIDGLEATAEIRRWERTTGTHVPIIAMTAHAMKGDRERCLGAGIDGYTSKPIRIRELEQSDHDIGSDNSSERVSIKKRQGRTSDRSRGAAGRFRWQSSAYQPAGPFVSGRLSAAPCGNQGSDPSRRCQGSGESSTRTKRLGGKLRRQECICGRPAPGNNGAEPRASSCYRGMYRAGVGTGVGVERTQKVGQKLFTKHNRTREACHVSRSKGALRRELRKIIGSPQGRRARPRSECRYCFGLSSTSCFCCFWASSVQGGTTPMNRA
jgi:CheY-like chemotaxis protein